MASDVMSLFGLDPNMIQQNRTNKAVSQASAMNPYFAAGAAGGALVGQGVNSMFGLQTPDMAQAQGVQDSMSGVDLSTPAGMRKAASQLMMNGDYAQAMALHSRANELEAEGTDATRATEDRALGKPRNVIIQAASSDALGTTIPAISHSITEYADGRVADATLGKEFKTYAEWMTAVQGGGATIKTEEDSTVTNLSPLESVNPAQQDIDSAVSALEEQILFTSDESKIASLQEQIEDVKLGDPDGTERKIKNLKGEASVLYAELRSGELKGFEIQKRINEIKLLKAHLSTLGATDSELSQLHKVTPVTP
jgi:hypothetical protein